ncbi:hypothetical protein [Paraburkholderia rhynchosiae]|uniref:Uncharacterized protein n=1 Tax=Paraburkholderia rhynchosiae TaxID=487049 RepID=A0A6J5CSI8_9BURK|nr:hypothetical protein [Paraburkholderia rhynchosiae]CAB3743736.1 hypothetical protein LMG27174_07040 [Paraburkholderia rhynchosiae]
MSNTISEKSRKFIAFGFLRGTNSKGKPAMMAPPTTNQEHTTAILTLRGAGGILAVLMLLDPCRQFCLTAMVAKALIGEWES